ncbi:hypothetical protein niasHT_028696 [Heterodera trifolii]|uniref:Uncharacterized protein n=1 Tax=Heterodera trifolii TaxID=157864 RepID=A0ABD2JE68_9BILA
MQLDSKDTVAKNSKPKTTVHSKSKTDEQPKSGKAKVAVEEASQEMTNLKLEDDEIISIRITEIVVETILENCELFKKMNKSATSFLDDELEQKIISQNCEALKNDKKMDNAKLSGEQFPILIQKHGQKMLEKLKEIETKKNVDKMSQMLALTNEQQQQHQPNWHNDQKMKKAVTIFNFLREIFTVLQSDSNANDDVDDDDAMAKNAKNVIKQFLTTKSQKVVPTVVPLPSELMGLVIKLCPIIYNNKEHNEQKNRIRRNVPRQRRHKREQFTPNFIHWCVFFLIFCIVYILNRWYLHETISGLNESLEGYVFYYFLLVVITAILYFVLPMHEGLRRQIYKIAHQIVMSSGQRRI